MNAVMAPPEDNPAKEGLGTRVLSALVLAPVVLATVYAGPPYFEILIALGALLMALEWSRMCRGRYVWLVAPSSST